MIDSLFGHYLTVSKIGACETGEFLALKNQASRPRISKDTARDGKSNGC